MSEKNGQAPKQKRERPPPTKKVIMPEQDPLVRSKNFEEVALGYTAEQALEEANKCLQCRNASAAVLLR